MTMDNILPFRSRAERPAFAPGVVPFDRDNPAHVNAWNTLFAMGWAETKFRDKERQERSERVGLEVV